MKEFPDGDKAINIISWAKDKDGRFPARWRFYELCLKYELRFKRRISADLYPILWEKKDG